MQPIAHHYRILFFGQFSNDLFVLLCYFLCFSQLDMEKILYDSPDCQGMCSFLTLYILFYLQTIACMGWFLQQYKLLISIDSQSLYLSFDNSHFKHHRKLNTLCTSRIIMMSRITTSDLINYLVNISTTTPFPISNNCNGSFGFTIVIVTVSFSIRIKYIPFSRI